MKTPNTFRPSFCLRATGGARPHHGGTVFALVLAALLAIPALSSPAAAQTRGSASTSSERDTGRPERTDREVGFAVERALRYDTSIPANHIDVSTTNGVVTLTGTVDNLLAQERAAKITAQVRGVRSIVNRLQVDPMERADSAIRRDVEQALLFDAATDEIEIDTRVHDGAVTLSGTVQSWQEQQLALHVAKGVKGVREVVSDLRLTYIDDRPDEEIRAEVRRTLDTDVWVDPAAIEVDVQDGAVALTGVVASVAEKNRAYADAWTAGVRSVNTDALDVQPWLQAEGRRRSPPTRSDAEIAAAVQDALRLDPRVYSFSPKVDVDGGIVTLTGVVSDLKAAKAAARDARNTAGVRRVDNFLKVRTTEPVEGGRLASTIRDKLELNVLTESEDIGVTAVGGDVTLTGTVDSYLEKAEAEDVAQSTTGVTRVRNQLSVRYPTYSYYDYEYDPYWDYDPYYLETGRNSYGSARWPGGAFTSDSAVRERIEGEFFWSPFVDGGDIDVSVENGTAVLDGEVDSIAEMQSATENAYEGGAHVVINNLHLASY